MDNKPHPQKLIISKGSKFLKKSEKSCPRNIYVKFGRNQMGGFREEDL